MVDKDKKGFAIAGFVLGIVSFIPYLEWLGILGIIFSVMGMKSEKKGFAIAGLVISIISLLLLSLFIVVMIISNMIGSRTLVPFLP